MRIRIRRIAGLAIAGLLFATLVAEPGSAAGDRIIFQGVFTDRETGEPIAGACVSTSPTYLVACTDTQGRYEIGVDGTPFTYSVSLRALADGYTPLFSYNVPSMKNGWWLGNSNTFPVTANFKLSRGSGTVTNGLAPATMRVVSLAGDWEGSTATASLANVPPGRYRVAFSDTKHPELWVPRTAEPDQATVFEVTGGATITATDELPPLATLEVRVVDAETNAPVSRGCVWASVTLCDRPDGVYRVADVVPGQVVVGFTPYLTHTAPAEKIVVVKSGETTVVTLRVQPAATLKVRIDDRAQPSYHPETCIVAMRPAPTTTKLAYACNTAPGGTHDSVIIGGLPPGDIELFAVPKGTVYGAQWVGATGGVGDRRYAQRITLRTGQRGTATVRLDRAGSISGRIKDRWMDAPIGACAHALPEFPLDQPLLPESCTNSDGYYRIDGLGPYSWPIMYANGMHVPTWSGGADNRFSATPVKVTAGATVTADMLLVRARSLTVDVYSGSERIAATVFAFDAATGDPVGSQWYADQRELHGMSDRAVVLAVRASGSDQVCWYRTVAKPRQPGFAVPPSATSVRIDVNTQCVSTTPWLVNTTPRRPRSAVIAGGVVVRRVVAQVKATVGEAIGVPTVWLKPTPARIARVKP